MFARSSLGAGPAAGWGTWALARCRVLLCALEWALAPLQGAAVRTLNLEHVAMCALELGCFWAWHGVWAGMRCLGPCPGLA